VLRTEHLPGIYDLESVICRFGPGLVVTLPYHVVLRPSYGLVLRCW